MSISLVLTTLGQQVDIGPTLTATAAADSADCSMQLNISNVCNHPLATNAGGVPGHWLSNSRLHCLSTPLVHI